MVGKTVHLVLGVDQRSLAALSECNYSPYFGLGKARFYEATSKSAAEASGGASGGAARKATKSTSGAVPPEKAKAKVGKQGQETEAAGAAQETGTAPIPPKIVVVPPPPSPAEDPAGSLGRGERDGKRHNLLWTSIVGPIIKPSRLTVSGTSDEEKTMPPARSCSRGPTKAKAVAKEGLSGTKQRSFDNTPFEAICEAAEHFGIEESITEWADNMLRSRIVTTELSDTKVRARVRRGCPQGGVTSPLMWLLVINELLVRLEKLGVHAVGYVDDVALMIRGSSSVEIRWRMQRALDLVQNWCTDRFLKVNSNKTEMVLFTKKRKHKLNAPSIFDTELKFLTEIRYLGVTLDNKLTWRSHIGKQAQKATATFWACRRIFGTTWGLKPKLVKWIYMAILIPQLTFASVIWWPAIRRDVNIKALNKVYRLALLGIIGEFKTTPTLAMGALLNVVLPNITVESLAVKTSLRLHFVELWSKARTGHASILRNRDLEEVLAQGGDYGSCSYHFRHKYKVLFPNRQEWEVGSEEILSPQGLVWFTDGSKRVEGAGAGIYTGGPETEISLRLGHTASIFQAEVYAIWACVKHILELNHRNKHIYICRDSGAALKSLTSVVVTSKLVPGHSGIKGNNIANELARSGACETGPEPVCSVPVPLCFIRSHLAQWTCDRFWDLWLEAGGMQHTRALVEGPSKSLGTSLVELDRSKPRIIVGLVTGHWFTGRHLKLIGITDDSVCPRCNSEDETPLHLLSECRALEDVRKVILEICDSTRPNLLEVGMGRFLRFSKSINLPIQLEYNED
ncbi:uncharacterized protein LOC130671935 [Microplitis mediator]|uniref:uncharacterized protein LOC130671935 n=1 Tax=Microplitis mediator TaxID=375433 RepID=UPI0025568D95|nr:uncharacterized protein LOC130671935 [Microplitis mediator]